MGKRKKSPGEQSSEPYTTREIAPQEGQETNVPYRSAPPTAQPDRSIHPRKKIPPLPPGNEVPDMDPTPPLQVEEGPGSC